MKSTSIALAATFLALSATGFAQETQPATQPATETVAVAEQTTTGAVLVVVNGAEISQADVDKALAPIKRQIAHLPAAQQAMFLNQFQEQALEDLITQKVLLTHAAKEGVKVTKEDISAEIEEVKTHLGGEELFKAALEQQGVTTGDLEKLIHDSLMIERAVEKQRAALPAPSEEEVSAFFETHKDNFSEPETVRASHILVQVDEDATAETKAEKLKKAQEVLGKVKAGGDFAALARENSDCPSAERGGDLGSFERGQMVKPFEDVAFALETGKTSELVETQFGYHIIKVSAHEQAVVPKLDDVREDIVAELQGPKLQDWVEELRKSAKIERKSN